MYDERDSANSYLGLCGYLLSTAHNSIHMAWVLGALGALSS
jgi:hypothetical protein